MNENRLNVFKMANVGKTQHFGISLFCRSINATISKKAHFVIVLNDSDLDHVVNLLFSQGCTTERIGLKKDTIILDSKTNLSVIQLYCLHLVNHSSNIPSKEETLLNSIRYKYLTDVTHTSDRMLGIATRKNCKSLIHNNWCVTSVFKCKMNMHIL